MLNFAGSCLVVIGAALTTFSGLSLFSSEAQAQETNASDCNVGRTSCVSDGCTLACPSIASKPDCPRPG